MIYFAGQVSSMKALWFMQAQAFWKEAFLTFERNLGGIISPILP